MAVSIREVERSGIYIVSRDGFDATRVLEDVTGSHLEWSPDGSALLVSNVMASPDSRDPQHGIFLIRFGEGWAVEDIRTLPLSGVASWSPDGSRIAAWDSNAGVLVTVAADGTDRQIIAHDVDGPGVTAVP